MTRTIPDARWDENRSYWRVNVQQDGVRKTFYDKTPGKRGKKMCEAKAAEWLDANAPGDLKFKAAVERYLASKKPTVRETTYDIYDYRFRQHLLPVLGEKRLSQISEQQVQDILNRMAADGYSHDTCAGLRSSIKDFSTWCRKSRLNFDRMEYLDIPRVAVKGERTTLQPEHLAILFRDDSIQDAKHWHLNAFRFCAIIGLRRGELCGLMWTDIENGVLTVARSVNGLKQITEPKTEAGKRRIRLPQHALKVLQDQKAKLAKYGCISPYIFPGKVPVAGEMADPKSVLRSWTRFCQQNGMPEFKLHELRHTAISMYKADLPEELLKSVVGHSVHMDTYSVYGHEFGDDAQRAAACMDTVLDKVLKAN